MNPLSVRLFDINRSEIVTNHFYDMCCAEEDDGSKAKAIIEAIDEKFSAYGMPYENCITLSVDNASTRVGVNNSVASRFKTKNENVFIGGCPCHLAHSS